MSPAKPAGSSITRFPTGTRNCSVSTIFFSGVTEQAAYGAFTLATSATWQAGQYIKFTLGGGMTYAQSHLITAADVCTPNGNNTLAAAGPCVQNNNVQGVPNPDHRDIIDLPGHRFSVDDTTMINLWIMGTVMF